MLKIGGIYNFENSIMICLEIEENECFIVETLDIKNNSNKSINETLLTMFKQNNLKNKLVYQKLQLRSLNNHLNGYLGQVNQEILNELKENLFHSYVYTRKF